MTETDQLYKILGFANRARRLTLGMSATMSSLIKNKAKTILLASDISENAGGKIKFAAEQKNIPVYTCGSKTDFGRLFDRREVGIVGIVDAEFAKSIAKILK